MSLDREVPWRGQSGRHLKIFLSLPMLPRSLRCSMSLHSLSGAVRWDMVVGTGGAIVLRWSGCWRCPTAQSPPPPILYCSGLAVLVPCSHETHCLCRNVCDQLSDRSDEPRSGRGRAPATDGIMVAAGSAQARTFRLTCCSGGDRQRRPQRCAESPGGGGCIRDP